jgi:nitrogen fixation NifU-like protein
MSEMEDLYQEIILEHNKRPRNYRFIEAPTHHAEGNNPMCGDEVELFLRVEDGVIVEVTFQGQGCAISKASASLLTEQIQGKTVDQAHAAFASVMDLLKNESRVPDLVEDGEMAALTGVRKFPARIKCATLPWHALEAALAGQTEASTEG